MQDDRFNGLFYKLRINSWFFYPRNPSSDLMLIRPVILLCLIVTLYVMCSDSSFDKVYDDFDEISTRIKQLDQIPYNITDVFTHASAINIPCMDLYSMIDLVFTHGYGSIAIDMFRVMNGAQMIFAIEMAIVRNRKFAQALLVQETLYLPAVSPQGYPIDPYTGETDVMKMIIQFPTPSFFFGKIISASMKMKNPEIIGFAMNCKSLTIHLSLNQICYWLNYACEEARKFTSPVMLIKVIDTICKLPCHASILAKFSHVLKIHQAFKTYFTLLQINEMGYDIHQELIQLVVQMTIDVVDQDSIGAKH